MVRYWIYFGMAYSLVWIGSDWEESLLLSGVSELVGGLISV